MRLLINALAFYAIARFVPGFHVSSFTSAIVAAVIFGIVNAIVRPLVLLVTLPLTIVTLGIFVLIVNALMIWLTAILAPGVHIDSFEAAFAGGLIMLIVSLLTSHLFKSETRSPQTTTSL